MTPAELDALEARLATIDDEVWTVLGGNANATMGHIKALRAAAPHLIAQARALEGLRGLAAKVYRLTAESDAAKGAYVRRCLDIAIDETFGEIVAATLTLFPEET